MVKWYIMTCRPNRELSSKKKLETEIIENQLSNLIEEVHVPTNEVKTKMMNGQIKTTKQILFNGYILIKMDWENPLVRKIILSQKDIKGFVGSNKTDPNPISEKEVQKMLGKQDNSIDQEIMLGHRTVKKGIFKDFKCEVLSISGDKANIKTNAFGREIKIEINLSDL